MRKHWCNPDMAFSVRGMGYMAAFAFAVAAATLAGSGSLLAGACFLLPMLGCGGLVYWSHVPPPPGAVKLNPRLPYTDYVMPDGPDGK